MQPDSIVIAGFTGMATKVIGHDQPPGTLRVADGVNVVPVGALTFGPVWGEVWGLTASYRPTIDTALSGAATNKVHFLTLAANGQTFLLAWEYQNGSTSRARGLWHVAGSGDPLFATTYAITLTATNNAVYRDKTVGLNSYGSWIGGELWLGNGTDTNLVWNSSAALALLETGIATTTSDTSQFTFPPCKSWVRDSVGFTYGAGNVTYPLRAWRAQQPNLDFPKPHGIYSQGFSYADVRGVRAAAITALGFVGESLVAHMNIGGPVILLWQEAADGWAFDIRPVIANGSAINPACQRDVKVSPFYFGTDLEVYALKQRIGYERTGWRADDLLTEQSSGEWNAQMTKPASGDDYFTIYDERNGRLWQWASMSAGSRQGVYSYDQRSRTVTGPWRYPDFVAACQLRDENLNGCLVLGVTRDGVLIWSDVANIGELTPVAYGTSLVAPYLPTASAPTPAAGVPYVGIDSTTGAAIHVLNAQTLYKSGPWADWATAGTVTPDLYFNNAHLAVVELADLDSGRHDLLKEWFRLRSTWQRNSYAYLGVAGEVNGYQYWRWPGCGWPYENWLNTLRGQGHALKLRLVIVTFNDLAAPAVLESLTPEFVPANYR